MDKFLVPRKRPREAYSEEGIASNTHHGSILDKLNAEAQRVQERAEEEAEDIHLTPVAKRTKTRTATEMLAREEDGSMSADGVEYRKHVMYVDDCVTGVIPRKTNEICLWDMQPFTGVPFPVPVGLCPRRKSIHVVGYTCSVACALSYAKTCEFFPRHGSEIHRMIVQFARDYFGAKLSRRLLVPAPPREKLGMLHAKYTREQHPEPMKAAVAEFRNGAEQLIFHYHPPVPLVRVTRAIDEEVRAREQDRKHNERLQMLSQAPKPIASTDRGMREQRKYVLNQMSGAKGIQRGAIDEQLGVTYTEPADSSSSESE